MPRQDLLEVNKYIQCFQDLLDQGGKPFANTLFAGVDLGTTSIVLAALNKSGEPVCGALTSSNTSIRDGLILDYLGSIKILRQQVSTLRQKGYELNRAAVAYPPGTLGKNARAFANVLEAVDLQVELILDEPSAAAEVLGIDSGVVVDIGGGTTGISVIDNGQVVFTADEPTGGTHLDLVIAGHYKIKKEDAELLKMDPERQKELFPLVKPVFQKISSIVIEKLKAFSVQKLFLVGGTSSFAGIEKVFSEETGLKVLRPKNPHLVTPLGIALSLYKKALKSESGDHVNGNP